MKYSVINAITALRGEAPHIEPRNSNEYRVLAREEDGLSAYYFSCPIYRKADRRVIDLCWHREEDAWIARGRDAVCRANESGVELSGAGETLSVSLGTGALTLTEEDGRSVLEGGGIRIFPSFAGVLCKIPVQIGDFVFRLSGNTLRWEPHCSFGYLWFLRDRFLPSALVEAVCGTCEDGSAVPLELGIVPCEGEMAVHVRIPSGVRVLWLSLGLYCRKLFLDTTVDSAFPDHNGVYGGAVFLGLKERTQWLYSRIDPVQLEDLRDYRLCSARLVIPMLAGERFRAEVCRVSLPWCSFGATWNRRREPGERICELSFSAGAAVADITPVVQEILSASGPHVPTGIVIRGISGTGVLSTGDNCFAPQILDVRLQSR